MHLYIYIYIYVNISHAYIYIYIHTHTYNYTQTCALICSWSEPPRPAAGGSAPGPSILLCVS